MWSRGRIAVGNREENSMKESSREESRGRRVVEGEVGRRVVGRRVVKIGAGRRVS